MANKIYNFIRNNTVATFILAISILFTTEMAYAADANADKGLPDIGPVKIIRAGEIEEKEWTIENYRIDTGDVLEVSVWQVEELHREVVVRPDGRISFPLVGDLLVAGYTLDEVTNELREKLKTYIKEPQVSIMVKSFGGKKVVILGEVENPGIIRFTEPIRVLEAVALSGGYNEAAGLKNVLIIRGDLKNYTEVIVVNVVDILKGHINENIYLRKDDIIYMPRSFVGNVAYFIRQISPLLGAATTYYNIKTEYYGIQKKLYAKGTDADDTKVYYGSLK
jgi:polysaccharide export outer membrane protein